MRALAIVLSLFLPVVTISQIPATPIASAASGRVQPNDNRVAAGRLEGGVLVLRLEARIAVWHPDGDSAPGTPMAGFAEVGGAPQIPGPLLRARAGTTVQVQLQNSLRDTLLVHGLHDRTTAGALETAPLLVAPGELRSVRFKLDAPGSYLYWATTMRRAMEWRTKEDAQLTGAIIVDDGGRRTDDRIFVLTSWTDTAHKARTQRQRILGVVNGRSWPHTERLHYTAGDSVRWHVINGTADLHPMHLHGFYFRVDARGNSIRDTTYSPDARRFVVTEGMLPGTTMRMTWVPERPGNWLFHCHVPEHFGPRGSLGMPRAVGPILAGSTSSVHANHAIDGMNGLVVGVEVRPARNSPRIAERPNARHLRLLVRANRGSTVAKPFFGYAIHESGAEPPLDSGMTAGPPIDLVRGQPVRITVVNRLQEPTAVHWHGIELESYYDGVPGFSGAGRRITPLIAPGDSFEVRFTPPRSGTFIYHTHADEERQQLAGLAGVLIVSDSGKPRDAATDLPFLLTAPNDLTEAMRSVLINGQPPKPIEMRVGVPHRLRIVQMSALRAAMRVEAKRDSSFASWRIVAKDGADAPEAMRVLRPARTFMGIGEILDVEITPDAAGEMRIEVSIGSPWPAPSLPLSTVRIIAR